MALIQLTLKSTDTVENQNFKKNYITAKILPEAWRLMRRSKLWIYTTNCAPKLLGATR